METLKEKAIELKRLNPNWGYLKIAKHLNCAQSTIQFHLNPKRKIKVMEKVHNIYSNNKKYFVELFGGKCERCGYSKCYAALEFHHKDPEMKEISIARVMKRKRETALIELKKCELICSNCHREEHWKNRV